jgi:cellobiose epimerase
VSTDKRLFDILQNHAVRPWFPRSIDQEHGGFLSGFDASWQPVGDQAKQLEFQARQTSTAAELHACFPKDETIRRAVDAGWSYLKGPLWDSDAGGWFALTDRGGRPMLDGLKHAHGIAYAIEACFALAAIGNMEAKALGEEGLLWLHLHAYDAEIGGYWGPLTRSGKLISEANDWRQTDLIGTQFGVMDMNVNKDLLAAFTYAAKLSSSHFVRQCYEDTLDFVLRQFGRKEFPAYFIDRRGEPAGNYWKPSESVQAAASMIEARSLGVRSDEIAWVARSLFFRSFDDGWNKKIGALIYARSASDLSADAEADLQWWSQFELLKAARYFEFLEPEDQRAANIARLALQAIEKHFLDHRHGGVFAEAVATLPLRDRVFPTRRSARARRKGDAWKDASHETRALLRLLQIETVCEGKLPGRIGSHLTM